MGPFDQGGSFRPLPGAIWIGLRSASTLAIFIAAMIVFAMPGRAVADDVTASCRGAAPNLAKLQVSVSGMRSANGNVTITIYPDDASHFLDGTYKVARQILPVVLPVTTACFALPQPGPYAVALFHDENSNHHLDTNALGVPTEGYGFSINPTLYFGPPDLKRVRFALHAGDNPVDVRMKYY